MALFCASGMSFQLKHEPASQYLSSLHKNCHRQNGQSQGLVLPSSKQKGGDIRLKRYSCPLLGKQTHKFYCTSLLERVAFNHLEANGS